MFGSRPPVLERIFAGHHDVLAALRSLRRSPGFVAIAVLSLGLAIGLHTTTFALLDAVRNPYLPYDRPEELLTVFARAVSRDRTALQQEMYFDLRERSDLFAAAVPWTFAAGIIEANGRLEQGTVYTVGTAMSRVLGIKPVVGRMFNADRDDPSDAGAAVISYQLWSERFGQEPNLDRLTVSIADRSYAVIGVLPAAAHYPGAVDDIKPAVWLALPQAQERTGLGVNSARLLLRLKPGDTVNHLMAQLKVVRERFMNDHRTEGALFNYGAFVVVREPVALYGFKTAMGGVSLLVLLVACEVLGNGRAHRCWSEFSLGITTCWRQLRSLLTAEPLEFVAIAVLSLGLAIGHNTTTFALIDAFELPLSPYERPDELFTVVPYGWGHDRGYLGDQMYRAIRDRNDLFAAFVPYNSNPYGAVVEANGHLLQRFVVAVGPQIFRVLGVKPFVGRVFNADREDPSDVGTAVISYQLWREQFGGSADVGKLKVSVDDVVYSVVGVVPPDAMQALGGDVWLPIGSTGSGWNRSAALVRLKPGDTRARVKTQLNTLAARFAADYRGEQALFDYRLGTVIPRGYKPGDLTSMFAMMAWIMFVIACLNLANLMLARGLARHREIAVRMAVGASGGAVMRYVITECAGLAVLGGSWGVLLPLWGVKLAEHHMPPQAAALRLATPHLNWRIVVFGVVVTAGSVLLAGLVPALRARRTNVNEAMKEGGGGSTGRPSRSYRYLVVGEVALALFVLIGSTSSVRLMKKIIDHPPSYDDQHSVSSFVYPGAGTCRSGDTLSTFVADLAARARSVPGVKMAAGIRRDDLSA